MFEPLTFKLPTSIITYVTSDGKEFKCSSLADKHEKYLTKLRSEWYDKRFSIKGDLLYFLFKIEPKKPYNF